ncbi:MAG TPA: type II toxin-antitoxin system VapC family toxin [Thermoanaerobaculia bacterium]|nr:type II toxin-antitoxin system VapC family toxin [Thermoanaerobaculia bacterium]
MILLDTHAWIWWAAETPRRLSARARRAIADSPSVGVSAISAWEVAMLVAKGRLELDRDVLVWIRQALSLPRVTLVPLTPEIAVRSTRLGDGFPGDPADRILVATARELGAQLVTKDRALRRVEGVRIVW